MSAVSFYTFCIGSGRNKLIIFGVIQGEIIYEKITDQCMYDC